MNDPVREIDKSFRELLNDLGPREQRKAIRGGLRREATEIRKMAINNLRASGIRSNKKLEKGVRTYVYSKAWGFMVTVEPRRKAGHEKGFYKSQTNPRFRAVPVLLFLESGQKQVRMTRGRRIRKAHSTGMTKRYGFIEATNTSARQHAEKNLWNKINENLERVARKHGMR